MTDGGQTIDVSLGDRSYPILIGTEITDTVPSQIVRATALSHAILFYDQSVESIADQLVAGLRDSGRQLSDKASSGNQTASQVRCDSMAIPSGETSKSIDQYAKLLQFCLETNADRRSVVIAVGGGVVGDLAGFVAASYTRGVRLVQIPTTLLSMVDSSVGGKTGVNLPGGKNMVGAFWQPELVAIDSAHLQTLPERDYISGIAEIIKYGVIEDERFFAWLESNMGALRDRRSDVVREAIACSCRAKAAVVGADEREMSGKRAILNYGHTFAHAIEATTGYGTLMHGEAVAIGMEMAMELAVRLSLIDPSDQPRQRKLIQAADLPHSAQHARVSLDPQAMLVAMARDKKVANGNLRFVLPSRIGHVDLVGDVKESTVIEAIEAIA